MCVDVLACARRGVNVVQLNLEEGLALFDDHSFDVVLQLQTLQHLRNTERMLRETARVGRIGIVSFPNFAHWPNRLRVLGGRMPVTKALPYQWFDTPNIRVTTFNDFEVLAQRCGPTCRGPCKTSRRCRLPPSSRRPDDRIIHALTPASCKPPSASTCPTGNRAWTTCWPRF